MIINNIPWILTIQKIQKKNIISPANKRENGINYNLLIKISNVPNLPSIYLKAKWNKLLPYLDFIKSLFLKTPVV